MKPFTDLKDLAFMQFCAEVERAYKAGEIDLMMLVSVAGEYAVYQDALKNEK